MKPSNNFTKTGRSKKHWNSLNLSQREGQVLIQKVRTPALSKNKSQHLPKRRWRITLREVLPGKKQCRLTKRKASRKQGRSKKAMMKKIVKLTSKGLRVRVENGHTAIFWIILDLKIQIRQIKFSRGEYVKWSKIMAQKRVSKNQRKLWFLMDKDKVRKTRMK